MTIVTIEEPTFANAVEKCVMEIQARYKALVLHSKRLNQRFIYAYSSSNTFLRTLNRAITELNAIHNDKTFTLHVENIRMFDMYYIEVEAIEGAPRTVDINVTDNELEYLYTYYTYNYYGQSLFMLFFAVLTWVLSRNMWCFALFTFMKVAPNVIKWFYIKTFSATPESRRKGLNILVAFNE